jgi:hypothetical protein
MIDFIYYFGSSRLFVINPVHSSVASGNLQKQNVNRNLVGLVFCDGELVDENLISSLSYLSNLPK